MLFIDLLITRKNYRNFNLQDKEKYIIRRSAESDLSLSNQSGFNLNETDEETADDEDDHSDIIVDGDWAIVNFISQKTLYADMLDK